MSDSTHPTGGVFLSYAREDADAARRIAEALRGFGIEVWFDQSELRGGDQWDTRIRGQIKTCALFLPIISATTQARDEAYFRLEWKLADDRSQLMAPGKRFIVPVVIDGTPETGAVVPESFARAQWTRLEAGEPTSAFIEQVKHLLEAPRHRPALKPDLPRPPTLPPELKRAAHAKATPAPAPPKKSVPPVALAMALGAVAVSVGLVFFVTMRKKPDAPVAAATPASTSLSPSPSTPAKADDKSIAVLAFANLSGDKANEYFSDGISEELLNVLAKVPGLKVSARTSAFYFKGRQVPVSEIAQQLGVAYIVEGSVQRADDRVKITTQLIKAADGFHVWSDTFTRDLKDIFAVQDEIAGLIASNLSLKLGAGSGAAASVDPRAFELYVRARQIWSGRLLEHFAQAEQLLSQALEVAPGFVRAHAALIDVQQMRAFRQGKIGRFDQRNSAELDHYLAQARDVLAIDPGSAEAYATMGQTLMGKWRWPEAIQAHSRAVELNPNYATGRHWLAMDLAMDGRMDEALRELKLASELDPFSPIILDNYGWLLNSAGRNREAIAVLERALELNPGFSQTSVAKVCSLFALGRRTEAMGLLRQIKFYDLDERVRALLEVGLSAEVASLVIASPDASDFVRAKSLLAAGRPDEALAMLGSGSGIAYGDLMDLLYKPLFDPVRRDPRFLQLMARFDLVDAHARAQAWRAAHPPEKPEPIK